MKNTLANKIHRVLSGERNPFLWGMDTGDLQRVADSLEEDVREELAGRLGVADSLEEDVREELAGRLGYGKTLGDPDKASDIAITRAFFVCVMRRLGVEG